MTLKKSVRKNSGSENFQLGRRYHDACLANWIANESQRMAVVKWMKNPHDFLVMLGHTGTGKTYFCAAILNYLWEQGYEIYYTNSRNLISKTQMEMTVTGDQLAFVKRICDQEILIIDDLGSDMNTEWQQKIILELIDLRYSAQKPTIVTSNFSFSEIEENLGKRTRSRLNAKENMIFQIWDKDRRYMTSDNVV